jgi:DNA helicase-2/ATP-dependent DNA helicase PcrA
VLNERNAAFRAYLDRLNPAQRRAVEQTEGPVVVIAGPGTGKTQMLAARVGKILLDTDTRPQNILCLTFTDAGVNAMRQRLLELIGPEGHRVPVYTFHSFCNRVIQENLEYFGRATLEPVTELERIEIVRDLLVKLPPGHPLREGQKDVFQFEAHVRDLFSTMKKEGWTADFVDARIDDYLAGLPTREEFIYQRNNKYGKKGELKTALLTAAHERMERLRAAARLFPSYLFAMEHAGRYEYEDMLLWVTRAFEQHETLLRTYQERYLYFLVDEFQDTNGAQHQLLQLLIDYWESPNVFIVGDDDQSIYEFQGARLRNLLDFYATYRGDLQTIVLEDNYRSPQRLLDRARTVIEFNRLRAVHTLDEPLTKALQARTPVGEPAAEPEVVVYENRLHEVAGTVDRIRQLLAAGVPAAAIAVLYARHRQSERLLALLERRGVPYQTRRPVNLLDLPLMQQFRELLRYLHDEQRRPFGGEHRLFRLLHAAFFDLAPLSLARIALVATPGGDQPQRWRELLAAPALLAPLGLTDQPKIEKLAARIEQWLHDLGALPLPALIERLYNQSGLLAYALQQADRVWWLEVLSTFLAFVEGEAARQPRFSLGRLLELLDSMDDNRVRLELQQQIRTGDGVQLLTAHSAKGLEFDYVFMLDCTEDHWESTGRYRARRFTLPDTLTLSGEEDALEARRRLFYVAMTRARRHLTLSYARQSDDGKPLVQARFVDETGLPKHEAVVAPAVVLETRLDLLTEPEKPVVTLPVSARLDELLQRFTLTITALNRFLDCPLAFYYVDVLGLPETVSEGAAYGQAVHSALQQFFLHFKAESTGPDVLSDLFAAEMAHRRGYFAAQSFEQRLALGREHLRRYYREAVPHWRRRAVVERRIDRVELDGVPVAGVLDKLEWLEDGTLRIVDYKTGSPDARLIAPPDDRQPHGGEFWRQLAFYQLLVERSGFYTEAVSSLALSWLEPDRRAQFMFAEFTLEPAQRHELLRLVSATYARIRNRDFTQGCGEDGCVWCAMHRRGEVPPAWPRPEERLDDGR